MKKFILAFLIAVTPLTFFGCGDPDVEDPGEEVAFEKLEGVIRKLGASIYQQGTHRLEKNDELVALLESAGSQIKLDSFVGKDVEVEGIISPTVEGNLQIMRVAIVTPIGGATEGVATQFEEYSDDHFGFSVRYPTELTMQQTRRGAAFSDEENKIIEIVILENPEKQDLAEWLIENYGYTIEALRRVSIAGLVGYQFQNATGSVIYLGHEDKIFTLAWYDNSEINRARNRRYYLELVQNFSVSGVTITEGGSLGSSDGMIARVGEFCGGIAAITCAPNLECRLSGNYPDAGGICVALEGMTSNPNAVTSDQIAENSELPDISAAELQRGWYYGDREQKKPGTPLTWILVDSGSRSAMWRRLGESLAEPEPSLTEPNTTLTQLSTEQKKIFDYLKENISAIAPEAAESGEWKLSQLAFADPNFVYAVFSAGEQTRRALLVVTVVGDEISTEMQSYFKPGEERDWIVIEGADTAFGKSQTVVNTSGEITTTILENYRLFTDSDNGGIELQYPKNWYWRKVVTKRIEFASKPFPAGIPLLTVEVVDGADFSFSKQLIEDGEFVVYRKMNDEQSYRISALSDYEEVFLVANDTFLSGK